jgi:hypothetical protein
LGRGCVSNFQNGNRNISSGATTLNLKTPSLMTVSITTL